MASKEREAIFILRLFWRMLRQAVHVGCTRRSDADAVTSGESLAERVPIIFQLRTSQPASNARKIATT